MADQQSSAEAISASEVMQVARLAKLQVPTENVSAMASQLSRIVGLFEQLKTVNTDGVEPLAHAMDLHSVLRDDQVRAGLDRADALANAPQHNDECFRVPPVM